MKTSSSSSTNSTISVTTTTGNCRLQTFDLVINLFSLAHYLDEFGNTEFPEIGKITMNFGRQRNPTNQKRIFFTALWFKLVHEGHNLCLKFWANGSLHVTGMINHVTETKWLSHWVAQLFEHIENKPVTCPLTCSKDQYCNLKVCMHNVIWSKKGNYPIGWVPSKLLPLQHQHIGLHGKPVKPEYDPNGKIKAFVTTKGKREHFDADGDLLNQTFDHKRRQRKPHLAMTNRCGEEYTKTFGKSMPWTISCINAKCEKSREPTRARWLPREHFTKYMQKIYGNVQTSFDPNLYKAVQLIFFDKKSSKAAAKLSSSGIRKPIPQKLCGRQMGTVSVTSTGLFWLYGFKDLKLANERATHMVTLLKQYKLHLRSQKKS